MFLAEVIAVNVDEEYIDSKGALDLEKAGLLAYAHGFYYTLGRKIGKFGFSVEKKIKTLKATPSKFSKEQSEKKFKKANQETSFIENGVEVIIAKPKFKKQEKKSPKTTKKEETSLKATPKFAKKDNKKTNYTETIYKKKSDGSFKKKNKI